MALVGFLALVTLGLSALMVLVAVLALRRGLGIMALMGGVAFALLGTRSAFVLYAGLAGFTDPLGSGTTDIMLDLGVMSSFILGLARG